LSLAGFFFAPESAIFIPPLSMPRRSRSGQNSALKIMELDLLQRVASDSFQSAGIPYLSLCA
jgi:hypothetical protein